MQRLSFPPQNKYGEAQHSTAQHKHSTAQQTYPDRGEVDRLEEGATGV